MFSIDFSPLYPWTHTLNPLWISGIFYITSFGALLLLWRFFGKTGLYIYLTVTIIAANIQVLKGVSFPFSPEPIALGTVLFMSLFLCTDILAEFYGPKSAIKGIGTSFAAYSLLVFYMLLTLAYQPLTPPPGADPSLLYTAHSHIMALFTPAPSIFLASLISYLISQYSEVRIYRFFKVRDQERKLGKRVFISLFVSIFIDNVLFSFLAWYLFAPSPYPFATILWTYIIGVSLLRIILALGYVPLMYVIRQFYKRFIHDPIS